MLHPDLKDIITSRFLLGGLIIGFLSATPLGPIGVLCINRTLTKGKSVGVASGFGTAAADAIYSCVAGFGLRLISALINGQHFWFRLTSGLLICGYGLKTFFAKPPHPADRQRLKGLLSAFLSTFLLTLANPTIIISFMAIFAGLGVAHTHGNRLLAAELVGGVFLGALFWWAAFNSLISVFPVKLNDNGLKCFNKVSGVAIIGLGLLAQFFLET
ncbi:MAG: LysE family transporter [Elusimicrobia bacterium]|nr:LysE family transporter [Elusimicrobiota bacterium]